MNNKIYNRTAHFDFITRLAFCKNIDEYDICLRFFIKKITNAIAMMNANRAKGMFHPSAFDKLVR